MSALTGTGTGFGFYYFEEICGIPHTSHHEKALSDYCVQFAKAHGLACRQDEMGNVLIKAPATPGIREGAGPDPAGTSGHGGRQDCRLPAGS